MREGQAEEFIGGTRLVQALTRPEDGAHPAAHPGPTAWLRPASPDLALKGVLAGHQNRLAREQELFVDGHRRLADAQARFEIGMNDRFPQHLVSVVSDRAQISELSAALANTRAGDGMTLENLTTGMPVTDDSRSLTWRPGSPGVTTSQAPPPKQSPEFLAHGLANPATGCPLLSGYPSMIDMRKKSVLIPLSVKLR